MVQGVKPQIVLSASYIRILVWFGPTPLCFQSNVLLMGLRSQSMALPQWENRMEFWTSGSGRAKTRQLQSFEEVNRQMENICLSSFPLPLLALSFSFFLCDYAFQINESFLENLKQMIKNIRLKKDVSKANSYLLQTYSSPIDKISVII